MSFTKVSTLKKFKMKPSIIIFLVFFIPAFAKAQEDPYIENWSNKQIDSIRIELSYTTNDTIRMRLSRSLGWHYQEINRDSSLYFHEQQLALARKLQLRLWEADALDQVGWVLSQLKNYPLSLQYFLDAIKIVENRDCEKNIWHVMLFAKDKNPRTARLTVLGFIYNDMSQLYKNIGNDEKQLSLLLQSLKIGGSINNYTMLSVVSVNLAALYLKINKLDSAVYYAKQADDFMEKTRYKTYKGFAFTIIGNVYLKKNKYDSAKQYFEKSVFENLEQDNRTGLPYAYLCLADLFKVSGENDSSIYYTKKALTAYRNVDLTAGINDCYAYLYSLYKYTGNNDSAFHYIQLYNNLNDSLNKAEKLQLNEYQNVGFSEQIKMQELQNERTRRENNIRTYLLVVGIGVFMLIAFLLYRNNLSRKKANAALQKQNEVIHLENERKTKELEDARQLQLSMLPKELPKLSHLDIAVYMKTATEVGGDYYDFHIKPDGTLTVLVGDATGHGMMSGMMVSIMKSFFIADRNTLELKNFFESSNKSIKEMQLGRLMMACMGVQITSQKIIATNAGMPSLIYFRNKSQKAGEFVINHMPLGAIKGSKYSLKEINYEKGDTLLIMSDGFAELKNQNNEQYGYSRIKEEFTSVAQKNSNEIVEHLKNSASQWINETDPDDDVTFVVIKIK